MSLLLMFHILIWFSFFPGTGIITKYELFLRGPLESKNVSAFTSETRVFSSSGWLDPSVLPEQNSTKKTTLSPPQSSTIIEGMQAFSAYQLRVVSVNSAGNVTSEWTTAHTLEGGLYPLL